MSSTSREHTADHPAAKLLLASTSPRRRDLLDEAGIPYRLVPPGQEDLPPPGASPGVQALALARRKALGADVRGLSGLLLAADTLVAIGDRVLGKPADRDEAAAFLDLLCGRRHEVWTAHVFCPVADGRLLEGAGDEALERAIVIVRDLDVADREDYLDGREWADKAGGYGIQGLASGFARVVEGEVDTVVGLTRSAVVGTWRAYLTSLDG